MSAYPYGRPRRRGRSQVSPGVVLAVAAAAAGLAAAGHKSVPVSHAQAARVTAPAAPAYIAATLADLGAPDTGANQRSMYAWGLREGPWGGMGENNQWDTTLYEPGAWAFNTFDGGLHVWSYPTASEGAEATAATLEGGYPEITAALRSGAGLCGNPDVSGELLTWSGNGYSEVC